MKWLFFQGAYDIYEENTFSSSQLLFPILSFLLRSSEGNDQRQKDLDIDIRTESRATLPSLQCLPLLRYINLSKVITRPLHTKQNTCSYRLKGVW